MITVIVAVAIAGSLLGSGMAYAEPTNQEIINKLDALETQIDNIENKVNAMDARIFGTDNKGMGLEHLHSKINVIYDGKTYQAIAQMYHWLKNVNHHFAADTGIARETHNWMNDMRGDVSSIQGTVNNLPDRAWMTANVGPADLTSINANLTSIRSDIASVGTALTSVQSTLGTLPTQTWVDKNVIGNVTGVGSNVTQIMDGITTLDETLDTVDTTTSGTKTVVDAVKVHTTQLIQRVDAGLGSKITAAHTDVKTLLSSITQLATDIKVKLQPEVIGLTSYTYSADTDTMVLTFNATAPLGGLNKITLSSLSTCAVGTSSITFSDHSSVITHEATNNHKTHTFTNLNVSTAATWTSTTNVYLLLQSGSFLGYGSLACTGIAEP